MLAIFSRIFYSVPNLHAAFQIPNKPRFDIRVIGATKAVNSIEFTAL